jgi:hypothetical protein
MIFFSFAFSSSSCFSRRISAAVRQVGLDDRQGAEFATIFPQ